MNSTQNPDRSARLLRAIQLKKAAARQRKSRLPLRPDTALRLAGPYQRSLWLQHQLQPRSAAYNLASAFWVSGTLELGKLQRAFDEVRARHRILHSTFCYQGGQLVQVVADPTTPQRIERCAVAPQEVLEQAMRASRQPFDLETGPLLRLLLIEAGEQRRGQPPGERSLVVLLAHHILLDERSLASVWQQIGAAYEGPRSTGAEAAEQQTGEPEVQYDDFVHWHGNRPQRRQEDERDLAFWRDSLDPPPDELALPFANESPAQEAVEGQLLHRAVPAATAAGVRRLATECGCTPFAIFSFAFRLLLDRLQDSDDVAFGTPASMRSHPATAAMIGYFLNPVVARTRVDPAHTVKQALEQFDKHLREAIARGQLPFDQLVESLTPRRRFSGASPFFQVLFVHQEHPVPIRLGCAELEPVTLDLGVAKFDLTFFVAERAAAGGEGAALELSIEYRTARFAQHWMQRLMEHYEILLESLVADPQQPVRRLALLSAADRRAIEHEWQGGELEVEQLPARAESDASGLTLLPDLVLQMVARHGQRTAAVCGEERWSYAQLGAAATAVARALAARGVGKGDRVGLLLERSPRVLAAMIACHWVGAAYVPLDPAYPRARNEQALGDADVRCVLTSHELAHTVPEGPWRPLVVAHAPQRPSAASLEALPGAISELGADDLAYLLYTSGSTGEPKAAVVTHGNLLASTAARWQWYQRTPERFLLLSSVAFDSSVAGIFWMLSTAGTLVMPRQDEATDSRVLVDIIAREQVDATLCVPSLYAQLLQFAEGRSPHPLRSLRSVIVAGEACAPGLVASHFSQLPETKLFNEYGPTEATVWATAHEARSADTARTVAIGRPIPGVRVTVQDRLGNLTPPGVPGEAWIEGPTVAAGYWQRPELTAERFSAGRYRTGDRLSWTIDGRLLFCGRTDDQLKLRGVRIEPGEIEAAVASHPQVAEAALVLHRAAAGAPERLVAFVRPLVRPAEIEDPQPATLHEELRQHLTARLPAAMIPTRFVLLEDLPRLANGKVDRQALRERELAPEPGAGDASLDAWRLGTREQALLSLWQGLLGVHDIAPDDNFFELGGHSLLAVEVADAIERDHGVAISPAQVFAHPTLRQLMGLLSEAGEAESKLGEHLYPIQPRGPGEPLVFAIPHQLTHLLAQRFRGERPVYGLRGVGMRSEGNLGRWRSMTDLAEESIREIERRFPNTTLVLGGYSFGASLAAEVARLLEQRGRPVRHLFLIAPMPLEFFRLGPFDLRLRQLERSPREVSLPEAFAWYGRTHHPLRRATYQHLHHRLLVEPWRRLLQATGRLRRRLGLPLGERIRWADVRVDRFRLHRRWDPPPQNTPTTLLSPNDQAGDVAATWRDRFLGPFSVLPTPDPHRGERENAEAARVLFEQWDRVLESADSPRAPLREPQA